NPKGVIVKHENIVNTLSWRKDYYNYNYKDIVMQIPSYSFDSSVEDIFSTLLSGAKLVLLEPHRRMNTSYLKDILLRYKVTNFLITPSLYSLLLESDLKEINSIQKVTIAGENVSAKLVRDHFDIFTRTQLINEYGPTENSICSTCYEFSSNINRVYIGKPINNTRIYILDQLGKIVPI
ncbi:non-ribosomal peptide synthetase, partial [Bacillus cereus]